MATAHRMPKAASVLTMAMLTKTRLLVMTLAKTPPSRRNAVTSSDAVPAVSAISATLALARVLPSGAPTDRSSHRK